MSRHGIENTVSMQVVNVLAILLLGFMWAFHCIRQLLTYRVRFCRRFSCLFSECLVMLSGPNTAENYAALRIISIFQADSYERVGYSR